MVELIARVDSSPSLKYGSYSICLSGNLLLLFFRGTWSEKCAKDYVRDVSRFRYEHDLSHYGAIADITQWQLGTPEAINIVSTVIRRGAESGMVSQCLLAEGNNHLSLHIARQNVEKAFPGAICGTTLDAFLPDLSKHNILFNEALVRQILKTNGKGE